MAIAFARTATNVAVGSAFALSLATMTCMPAPAAAAEPVYKSVGPDGKTTYTDRAPPAGSAAQQGELRLATVRRDPVAAVFDPAFITARGPVRAGKAFLIQLPGCPGVILVTAFHLFGPAGGFGAQMTPAAISSTVERIGLTGIATGERSAEFRAQNVTPARAAPCCQAEGPGSAVGDIAAFTGPARRDLALPVSTAPVQRGARLTLVTRVGGGPAGKLRFEAVARGIERGYLAYDFLDNGVELRATSGAPVVNAAGEVVAIHLGGGQTNSSGRTYGIANPATAWRDSLVSSCKP